jgi:hypothetical protein
MNIRFLAPSRAHRWTVCAGSVRAEATAPMLSESSAIANEGTAAHYLFELCLRKKKDAEIFLGEELKLPKNAGMWTVDEDMVEHVQDGIDLVRRKVGKGVLWTERYVELKVAGVQCGGTLDCGWYGKYHVDPLDPGRGFEHQLHILDLKYGYGSVAEPRNNKQIRIYALGKLRELQRQGKTVDTVHLWIYQPRLDHIDGPFLHDVVDEDELGAFEEYLVERIEAAKDPKAPREAGAHCLYCAAHAVCGTAEKAMYRLVRNKFSEDDTGRVGALLFDVPMMQQWIKSIKDLGYAMAQNGSPPIGWILGAGRRSKAWNGDREKLVKQLIPKMKAKFGLKEDDYAPRKMLGVSRVTAMVPKDKQKELEALWHWTPGKEKLQPQDNARHMPRLSTYFDDEDEGAEREFLE